MFREEREDFLFDWSQLGDIEDGRPNLGLQTSVLTYRLMQFTLRDSIIRHVGVEMADKIFRDAGINAGKSFYKHLIGDCGSWEELVQKLQQILKDQRIGILRIEESESDYQKITLSVSEDLDCSGLPVIDEVVCTFDEGLLAGIFESYAGTPYRVREVECWCTGERVCRFKAEAQSNFGNRV